MKYPNSYAKPNPERQNHKPYYLSPNYGSLRTVVCWYADSAFSEQLVKPRLHVRCSRLL